MNSYVFANRKIDRTKLLIYFDIDNMLSCFSAKRNLKAKSHRHNAMRLCFCYKDLNLALEFYEAGLGDCDAEAGALADKVAVVKSESQSAFPALQLGGMPAGLHQHAEVMQHMSGRF